jgi:hypothetical protein
VSKESVVDFAKQKEQVIAGLALVDRLVCWVVIQPALFDPHVLDEDGIRAALEDGKRSVEQVDLLDRIFIMQWAVGGSADLEAFRKEWGESMAGLELLSGLQVSAE